MSSHVAVAVEKVSHRFPAVQALADVSLSFHAGQVHALVGENGAGKSTLMNILAGLLRPTAGQVRVAGQAVRLDGAHAAQRHGIAMIHQELNLVDDLTVAENIFLGREPACGGWLKRQVMHQQAQTCLDMVGCQAKPTDRAGALSIAARQQVEIARALSQNARILIMDEPTAVLTGPEVQRLLQLVRQLRDRGVAVLYVSHRLDEVLALADQISVLRDGCLVATQTNDGAITAGQLANLMVGRTLSQQFPTRSEPATQVVLSVRGVQVPGRAAQIQFDLRAGEILGLAGLIGAGRTSLAETLAGLRGRFAGQVHIDGRPAVIRSPRTAMQAGLAYVPEDRRGRGLIMGMSVSQNLTLAMLAQQRGLLIDQQAEQQTVAGAIQRFQIKAGWPNAAIETLSGGNQQKVSLAKWLATDPRVLIVDEPTRGIDVGAKAEIYRLIHQLAGRGLGCIVISSELPELLGLCHRIGVMRGGQLVAMVDGAVANESLLMHHAAGVQPGELQHQDAKPT